ncbi:hypothetical protein APHAL10511_000455 [Amanita phalloides]|nr:hypothetical protein APHAL10511_000455 [Amanita phalloides]
MWAMRRSTYSKSSPSAYLNDTPQIYSDHPSYEAHNNETDTLEQSSDENWTIPRLNDPNDLSKGIITTDKNKTNEYTILLVGETGTGKTSLLSLFANILAGHGPDKYVPAHEEDNEAGGLKNRSQTIKAKLYEFVSNNEVKVRILDTPGLADTRGLAQDDLHKASIATAIGENIKTVNAVIILANGTLERLGVATDYALSKLSSIFPRTLADNIGIIFTNVASERDLNFDQNSLPRALRGNENNQFLLNNPFALWNKSRSRKKPGRRRFEGDIHEDHRDALKELALVFNWLDTLVPQPTKDIVNLYGKYQEIELNIENALSRASQLAEKRGKLARIRQLADGSKLTMKQYENYRSVITTENWNLVYTSHHNTVCRYPQCYGNCHLSCKLPYLSDSDPTTCCAMTGLECRVCGHSVLEHRHYRSLWKEKDSTQVLVDEVAERKYNEAKQNNDEEEKMMIDLGKDIKNLDQDMEETLVSLGRLTESYANLCLGGSFSGQVRKSVRLLEMTLENIRFHDADPRSVELVEKSLEDMKKKLEVVQRVDEKVKRNFRPERIIKMAGKIKGALKSGIQTASTMLKPKDKRESSKSTHSVVQTEEPEEDTQNGL